MRKLFGNRKKKENGSKNKNENAEIAKKVLVFIDNENLWRSVKGDYPAKNVNYLELINFLKKKYAPDERLVVNLFISLLSKEEFNSGRQGFFRALDHIEQAYKVNEDIDINMVKVPAKNERVLVENRFEIGKISQVDQRIIIESVEEILPAVRKEEIIDKFILISGDSDYLPLLNLVRKSVTENIIVIAGEKYCNEELKISFQVEDLNKILEENERLLLDSTHSTF